MTRALIVLTKQQANRSASAGKVVARAIWPWVAANNRRRRARLAKCGAKS